MLIKFKITNIDTDFVYLQNQDNEELKLKKDKLAENIEINDELKFKLIKTEDSEEENLSKEILNEILNNSDNK